MYVKRFIIKNWPTQIWRLRSPDPESKVMHCIMIKGSIQEADITLVNIYEPNIGALKYIKQILTYTKGEIDGNTIIVDFNTPLTSTDRSSGQKINKATEILNDTIEQLDLIDIFRTLHPKKPRIHILYKLTWNIL